MLMQSESAKPLFGQWSGLAWRSYSTQASISGSDPERALEFLTGYLIEKALSVDNLFVFLVLFSYFAVPAVLQHRVLFWGIVGALLMRAGFIMAGAALIQQFSWIIYIFGAFLVFTGIKLLATRENEIHPDRNLAIRLFSSNCAMRPRLSRLKIYSQGSRPQICHPVTHGSCRN